MICCFDSGIRERARPECGLVKSEKLSEVMYTHRSHYTKGGSHVDVKDFRF